MENYARSKNEMNSSENNYTSIKFGATVTPIYLNIKDKKNPKCRSGCNSMTLDFSDASQDVCKIIVKNYYTYAISVLVMKISNTDSNRLKKWYVAIQEKVLQTGLVIKYIKSKPKIKLFQF